MSIQNSQDYKQLLTQVIKKQIVILGPDITLAKARNVPGLVVADDGTVTDISGDSQQLTQKLIDQFVQLSGEIVKKTMEPLLNMNPSAASATGGQAVQAPSVDSGQVSSASSEQAPSASSASPISSTPVTPAPQIATPASAVAPTPQPAVMQPPAPATPPLQPTPPTPQQPSSPPAQNPSQDTSSVDNTKSV